MIADALAAGGVRDPHIVVIELKLAAHAIVWPGVAYVIGSEAKTFLVSELRDLIFEAAKAKSPTACVVLIATASKIRAPIGNLISKEVTATYEAMDATTPSKEEAHVALLVAKHRELLLERARPAGNA